MNINIQEIINQKIKDMDESGVVEKAIQDTIEKTIISAITSALDGYSLKRSIEEKISKEVSDVVSDIGFTAYNSFIAEKVKAITEGVCNKDVADKIQKTFNEILIIKRDNIKLSEIFDKYREWICEDVEQSEKYDRERFHVKFEEDEKYGWFDVELAKEKPASKYGGRDEMIRFTLHRKHNDKSMGWIGSIYIDGVDIKNSFKFGRMSNIELLLINLTYNETPIEIDVDHEDDIDCSFDIDD